MDFIERVLKVNITLKLPEVEANLTDAELLDRYMILGERVSVSLIPPKEALKPPFVVWKGVLQDLVPGSRFKNCVDCYKTIRAIVTNNYNNKELTLEQLSYDKLGAECWNPFTNNDFKADILTALTIDLTFKMASSK